MIRFDHRVAIVTGAGRGIGASVARELARRGAQVVVNDLDVSLDGQAAESRVAAHLLADEIVADGGEAVADTSDIADEFGGEQVLRTALDAFGRLDILVNAGGIVRDRMIFNMTHDEWDAVIRVHLRGHFSTIRPASRYWREARNSDAHNRIINFTSRSGLFGAPSQPNYAAAKMGIVGLTLSCANALKSYGVTCNAIAPTAATRMAAAVPADRSVIDVGAPEYSPDSVTPLVTYLASERSDWINGRVLGIVGRRVTLYRNPEPERHWFSHDPWDAELLSKVVENDFRPV